MASDLVVHKVTFNRGNCPARFDDVRAERAYYELWGNTPENREWWRRTDYHGRHTFGDVLKIEASGSCGSIQVLEFEIQTSRQASALSHGPCARASDSDEPH